MEIQEIIRRWQAGEGYRQIASGTGLSRNTVRKYLTAAKAGGITREATVLKVKRNERRLSESGRARASHA